MMIDRYQVIKKLGEGTFGITYQAKDPNFPDTFCVIKKLKSSVNSSHSGSKERELFVREAEALDKIKDHKSPHVPQFYRSFSEKDQIYIVQEFIKGHNLRKELQKKQILSEEEVIQILRDGLQGLAFLHNQGFIHRDIKPENLMRRQSDHSIVIIDLGAVKEKTAQAKITQSLTRIGTPGYYPPEQDQGILIDSTDIYALGIVAIEALTGKPVNEIKNLKGEIQWPDNLSIDPQLKLFLERIVEDDYNKRYYSTANEAFKTLEEKFPMSSSKKSDEQETLLQTDPITQSSTNTNHDDRKNLILLIISLFVTIGIISFMAAFLWFLNHRKETPLVNQTPTPFSSTQITPTKRIQLLENPSFSVDYSINAFSLSQDGKTVIFGHDNGKITIWDLDNQQKLNEFSVYNNTPITALAINENGSYLAVGNKTGNLQIWNLLDRQNLTKRYELNHRDEITALAMTPDGQTLVSGGLIDNSNLVKIWELQDNKGTLAHTPTVKKGINSLGISQDGNLIVGGNYQGEITIWNQDQSQQYLSQTKEIGKAPDQINISLSSKGETMVASFCDKNVSLFTHLKTNLTEQKMTSNRQDNICLVAISPDGKLAAGLSDQEELIIWETTTQKELELIPLTISNNQNIENRFMTFSNDGKTLIVAINSEVIKIEIRNY
jgi:serine/threonine protein kinase